MPTETEQGSFASLLQGYRVAAGLSQEELAERAGLSRRGITDLERGARRSPHLSTVRRLAEALLLGEHERTALMLAARSRPEAPQPTPGAAQDGDKSSPWFGNEEGELKQATVLCCQLVQDAGRPERFGPDRVLDLLQDLLQEAREQIARYDGSISGVLGDGFIAVFGVPLAHEDHARRGVLAACEILRGLKDPLQVRMGLHSGWVAVARIGAPDDPRTTPVGVVTEVASAVERTAEPGTIHVSDATARLVDGFVRLSQVAANERAATYRVTGVGPRRSPLEGFNAPALTPFVGRTADLRLLQELWTIAEAGQAQVVGIVGEPGIGKTRLIHEFRRTRSTRPVTYLEGRCLSYGATTPYLPIIELIHSNFGILDADRSEAVVNKVFFGLQEVGLDPDDHADYVLHMLGLADDAAGVRNLGPEVIRARTFETLRSWIVAGAQRRPVLMVIEDLHWTDQTSEEFLATLVDSVICNPILVICTWRPEYRPKWRGHSYVTQIALRPLGANDSLSIVESVAQAQHLTEPAAHSILQRAEGNPFFIEELARSLGEGDHSQVVPDAVQGVLAARIDRLPPPQRRLLQIASVVGRDFSLGLLRTILDDVSVELAPALQDLQRLEFLFTRVAAGPPVLSFKHALTQEAAYASLSTNRRRRLHERIGRALLEEVPEIGDTQPELIAHHFTEAGLTEVAIGHWKSAGERAAQRSANVEAISHFKKALDLLAGLPESRERAQHELSLQIALGGPLIALRGYGAEETIRTYTRARDLANDLGDPSELFPLLFRRWVTHTIRSEEDDALLAAQEFLRLAEQQPDSGPRMMGHRLLGVTLFMRGELVLSQQEFDHALSLYDPRRHRPFAFQYGQDPRATILVWKGIGLWLMGDERGSEQAIDGATAAAADSGHVNSQAFVLTYGRCLLETLRGDASTIEPYVRSLVEMADNYRLAMWRAYARTFAGWMVASGGDPIEGSDLMRTGLSEMRSAGTEGLRPHLLGLLASTFAAAGKIQAAHGAIAEALHQSSTGGERWAEAELHRLYAEVLRLMPGSDQAAIQACFDQALAVARSQRASRLEQRILGSMGTLPFQMLGP